MQARALSAGKPPLAYDPRIPCWRKRPVNPHRIVSSTFLGALLLAGCQSTGSAERTATTASAPVTAATAANAIDPTLAVATFDSAWQLVYDSHFDPNFNGVDWPGVRDELRPKVDGLDDERELRGVIEDMLSRLGQSHFALLPREAVDRLEGAESAASDSMSEDNTSDASSAGDDDDEEKESDHEGDLGLIVAILDDEVVVTHVDDDGPAAQAGVRTGWVIEEIDGRNLSERLRELPTSDDNRMVQYHAMAIINARLAGDPETTVNLRFRDEDDDVAEVELTRRQRPGELVQFGNLPPMNANLEHERLVATGGAQVGVIRFTVWMLPLSKPFAAAVDDLRDVDGIVIDLRGNPGGVGGMAMGIAGHFVSDASSLGTMKMRTGELQFNISPRRLDSKGDRADPFTRPLAILVDRYTASTSEIFAAGMQSIGRARVFGETSAGAALPAQMNRLPNGDVLLHAFADFILPSGESVEGVGVVPDTPIELLRKDLVGGRDPVLDAAVNWIAEEAAKRHAAAMITK